MIMTRASESSIDNRPGRVPGPGAPDAAHYSRPALQQAAGSRCRLSHMHAIGKACARIRVDVGTIESRCYDRDSESEESEMRRA